MSAAEAEPLAKRQRQFFGKVPRCGKCHTCTHRSLKRACLVNRPPEVAAAANASRGRSAALSAAAAAAAGWGGGAGGGGGLEFLTAPPVEFPDDKPVPAHGIQGFKLPIVPTARAKKWTRTW